MIKFQVLSDIHLELIIGAFPKITPYAPYLFLAGDISNINYKKKSCISFFKFCNISWVKTFYVLGNHEYYSASNTIHEMRTKYKNFFKEHNFENIVLLDNDTYEIDVNTVVIGSTFWTKSPFTENQNTEKCVLNDYNCIFWDKKQKITSQNINMLSKTDYEFIVSEIQKYDNKDIIIMTHFPPYRTKTSHPKYKNNDDIVNEYFSWEDDTILKIKHNNIKYWISGHTHYSYDIVVNNIRLISNQYGYVEEYKQGESKFNIENVYN